MALFVDFFRLKKIPHYHGDSIRQIFVGTALLWLIATPIWGDILPFGSLFSILSALALVLLAALTNPRSSVPLIADALISGAGVFLLEAAAISFYDTDPIVLLVIREIAAIALIIAFYMSVKTARAMLEGSIGAYPTVSDSPEK